MGETIAPVSQSRMPEPMRLNADPQMALALARWEGEGGAIGERVASSAVMPRPAGARVPPKM